MAEYVQIKVKTIIKRLNDVKRQTNYLVCNIEGDRFTSVPRHFEDTMTIDTTNMCSHLQKKLFEEDGIYHHLWLAMLDDPELTAVVRSRQLHIYRNDKKVLVLAGKADPKVIREDKLCEMI